MNIMRQKLRKNLNLYSFPPIFKYERKSIHSKLRLLDVWDIMTKLTDYNFEDQNVANLPFNANEKERFFWKRTKIAFWMIKIVFLL